MKNEQLMQTLKIKGMPSITKHKRYGWMCKCELFFAIGYTREIAFQEWKKVKKESK